MVKKKAAKTRRKRRDMNPENPHNWVVVCTLCGTRWENTDVIDLTQTGHHEQEHPGTNPEFSVIWIGIGPNPKTHTKRRRF